MKPIIKFQSTHPRRVWHNFYFLLSLCTCFNPHTHAGCDSGRRAMRDAGSGFNPHTHAGCDKNQHLYLIPQICFNPHTHAGCDSFHLRSSQRPRMFQSTHPRRVWQKWNALLLKVRLFQSTHPRRVWHRGWHEQIPMLCFNPHTHAGCDRMEILENVLSIVSIHTPTQGVTVWTQPYTYRTFCFNPHTHAGCDGRFVKGHNYGFKFQSTHPRRVWPWPSWRRSSTRHGFNPHTHAGCDNFRTGI